MTEKKYNLLEKVAQITADAILEEYNKEELTIKVDDETIKINLKDIALVKTIFNW